MNVIEIPDPKSITEVADWVELEVSVSNSGLSQAIVASILEGASGEEPAESFITSVWRELERRQRLYSRPFFQIEGRLIEPESVDKPAEYIACLLLSLYGGQENLHHNAKIFEKLSCEAIKNYLSGEAIVFGWPFNPNEGRFEPDEPLIKLKIKGVAEQLTERFCESPPTAFKDRGLDVVGWIPFIDGRSSQLVVLTQSTITQDWKNKLPVPLDNWCQYIHWACNPVKAFSVPCIVTDNDWHEASKEKGLLFDRARIVNLLSDGIQDLPFKEELSSWVQQQLDEFKD